MLCLNIPRKIYKQLLIAILVFFLLGTATKPVSAVTRPLTIKILTLNLHNGFNENGQNNLEQALQLFKAVNPDIITLQEVERKHLQTFKSAGYQVIPGMNANLGLYHFGNVMLTRHRVVSHSHHYLPSNLEQRGLNVVVIDIEGKSFIVLNTHLGLRRDERKGQMDEMTRIISYLKAPLLIPGDFNIEPDDSLFTGFDNLLNLQEIGNVVLLPNTFPTTNPDVRPDQIWYSRHWLLKQAKVIPWTGSDHLPVEAELELTEPSPYTIPVEIPDIAKVNSPLLPDVSQLQTGLKISSVHSDNFEEITGSFSIPISRKFSITGSYEDNQSNFSVSYSAALIDLRDFASLLGVRGQGQWIFSLYSAPNEELWLEWEQYYRWSSHWGTRLIASSGVGQPQWQLEQLYLSSAHFGWSFGIDTDNAISVGIALTPDLRQVFAAKWIIEEEESYWILSWKYQF